MKLDVKETAEFLRYAMRYSLVNVDAVRAWGDTLIHGVAIAPEWMIDIALAKPNDADFVLGRVPGTCDPKAFTPLLCCLLFHRWRNGDTKIGAVRSLGWELHLLEGLPDSVDGFGDWGVTLEVQAESMDEGWVTEEDIRDLISRDLESYAKLENDLPQWLNLT